MDQRLNAWQMLEAFALVATKRDGFIQVRRVGGDPGYLHIVPSGFDPLKYPDRHVAIELHNGTVSVTERLEHLAGMNLRADERIEKESLGFSAGPSNGRFTRAIGFEDAKKRYENLNAFAEAALDALIK